MEPVESLITKYEDFIKRKSRFYGRDASEADELRQKALIVLWRDFYKLSKMNDRSVKAFLTASIKNALIDLRRREKKITSFDSLKEYIPASRDWENNVVDNILVMSVIHRLSAEEQDIVFKSYFMGMNSSEIGRQLEMPPSTIRCKLMRANRKLKKMLEER